MSEELAGNEVAHDRESQGSGADRLHGRYTFVGSQRGWWGDESRCVAYDWTCPEAIGKARFRFVHVEGESPRLFFLERLHGQLGRTGASAFLNKICECGFKALRLFEASRSLQQTEPEPWLSLFRNRNAGHFRVARELRTLADLVVDDGSAQQLELVVPGFPAADRKFGATTLTGFKKRQIAAWRLLKSNEPYRACRTAQDVFKVQQEQASRQPLLEILKSREQFFELPGYSPLDEVLIAGARDGDYAAEFLRTQHWVVGAMINGFDPGPDCGEVEEHREEFVHFMDRIGKKTVNCNAKEFDAWLRHSREHGFVRLLPPNSRIPGRKGTATAFFRIALWFAYAMVARAYGAVMLIAWMDFCDDGLITPTAVEQMLFQNMHCPQYGLGGIPISFLGPPHWLFAGELLNKFLSEDDIHDRDVVVRRLALRLREFSRVNSERRTADREVKRARRRRRLGEEPVQRFPSDDASEPAFNHGDNIRQESTSPGVLSSPQCEKCKKKKVLQLARRGKVPVDGKIWVELYCKDCDVYVSGWMHISVLEQLKRDQETPGITS